jgi:hypothetical protein
MAIDTAYRRRAALNYEDAWCDGIPVPDGEIDLNDQRVLLGSYPITTLYIAIHSIDVNESGWVRGISVLTP